MQKSETTPQRQLRKGSATMTLSFGHERRRRGAGGRDNATLGTRGREQRQLRKGSAKPTSLPQHPSSDIFKRQASLNQ